MSTFKVNGVLLVAEAHKMTVEAVEALLPRITAEANNGKHKQHLDQWRVIRALYRNRKDDADCKARLLKVVQTKGKTCNKKLAKLIRAYPTVSQLGMYLGGSTIEGGVIRAIIDNAVSRVPDLATVAYTDKGNPHKGEEFYPGHVSGSKAGNRQSRSDDINSLLG